MIETTPTIPIKVLTTLEDIKQDYEKYKKEKYNGVSCWEQYKKEKLES